MLIFDLKRSLVAFLDEKLDPDLLYDPGNNPYVSVTIVYQKEGKWCEEGFASFITLKGRPFSSTNSYLECVAYSKALQATYLESGEETNEGIKSDYGYCSSIMLSQNCHVVIAIIASPEDSIHVYTTIKNKVEILCEIY